MSEKISSHLPISGDPVVSDATDDTPQSSLEMAGEKFLHLPISADTIVTDATYGTPLGDGSRHLATASGRYVKVFLQDRRGFLTQIFQRFVGSIVVAVRFFLTGESPIEKLIVMTSERKIFLLSHNVYAKTLISEQIVCMEKEKFVTHPKRIAVSRRGLIVIAKNFEISAFFFKTADEQLVIPYDTAGLRHILFLDEETVAILTSSNGMSHVQKIHLGSKLFNYEKKLTPSTSEVPMELDEDLERDDLSIKSFTSVEEVIHKFSSSHYDINAGTQVEGQLTHLSMLYHRNKFHALGAYGKNAFVLFDSKTFAVCSVGRTEFDDITASSFDTDRTLLASRNGEAWSLTLVESEWDDLETHGELMVMEDYSVNAKKKLRLEIQRQRSGVSCIAIALNAVYAFYGSLNSNHSVVSFDGKMIQSLDNFGPIVDATILETDNPFNPLRILTISGTGNQTTLRVLDNNAEFPVVKKIVGKPADRLFALKLFYNHDAFILSSTYEGSQLYSINGEHYANLSNAFLLDETLYAADFPNCQGYIQVTHEYTRLGLLSVNDPTTYVYRDVETATVEIAVGSGQHNFFLTANEQRIQIWSVEDSYGNWSLKGGQRITTRNSITCMDLVQKNDSEFFVIVGILDSNIISVLNLPKMDRVMAVMLPENLYPLSLIANKISLIISTDEGVYNVSQFDLSFLVPGQPIKMDRIQGRYQFFHVNTLSPGLIGGSKVNNSGFIMEYRGHFPYFRQLKVFAACGLEGHASNYMVLSNADGIHLVSIEQLVKRIECGESVLKLAYQASSNSVALITSRVDSRETAAKNSLSLLVPEIHQRRIRISNYRYPEHDARWENSRLKEVGSIVVLDDITLAPKSSIVCGPYEIPILLASGSLNKRAHYGSLIRLHYSNSPNEHPSYMIIVFEVVAGRIVSLKKIDLPRFLHGLPHAMRFYSDVLVCRFGNIIYKLDLHRTQEGGRDFERLRVFQRVPASAHLRHANLVAPQPNVEIVPFEIRDGFQRSRNVVENIMAATEAISSVCLTSDGRTGYIVAVAFNCTESEDRLARDVPVVSFSDLPRQMYYTGCAVTSVFSTMAISTQHESMGNMIFGNQYVIGFKTGHLGVLVRCSPIWSSLLTRILYECDRCSWFRNKFESYATLYDNRVGGPDYQFIDGDKFHALMHMEQRYILQTIDKIRLTTDDLVVLGEAPNTYSIFLQLVDFYDKCLGFTLNNLVV